MTSTKKLRVAGKTAVWTAAIGLAVLAGTVIGGEGTNQQAKGSSGDQAQAVDDMALASQLAAYGQRNKDALSLIVAAKITKATATKEMAAKPKTEGPEGAKADGKKTHALDVAALLEQAAKFSGDDETLKTLAGRVKDEASRGARGGAQSGTFILAGGCKNVFDVNFNGGELASVAVVGDGSTDLDIFVYDENGNGIVADTRASGTCYVSWCPRWTGRFRIEVVNLGSVANLYAIATN